MVETGIAVFAMASVDEDWTPGGGQTSIWSSRPSAGGLDDEDCDDEDSNHSHTTVRRGRGWGESRGCGAGRVRGLALGTEYRNDGRG